MIWGVVTAIVGVLAYCAGSWRGAPVAEYATIQRLANSKRPSVGAVSSRALARAGL